MPPSSGLAGSTTSVVIAILGLFFFTRKVVRARTIEDVSSSSSSRSSSRSKSSSGSGRGGGTAFAVGLLDIAIPRDDRPGGSFRRVMVNDACITRAVQDVTRKLVVSLRDADCMPAGVVRAYVSEIYQDVYDAACAARHPHLDVRVLLPATATATGSGGGGSSSSSNGNSPSYAHANASPALKHASALAAVSETAIVDAPAVDGTGAGSRGGWATREVAELAPDLEVLFSDEPPGSGRQAALNSERIRLGIPPVSVVSLESVATRAHRPEYFYAEDILADIPTFSSVACGGTFDRLHGGHKKLLTLAASMCTGGTLTVGVTSDSMLKSKTNAHMLHSLPERLDGVRDFLRTLNPQMQMRVEEITDPFGPPISEEAFDAIAVSSETVSGAEKINELRAQKGFRPLAVAVTRRMAAATLSSSYLRRVAEKKQEKERRNSRHAKRA